MRKITKVIFTFSLLFQLISVTVANAQTVLFKENFDTLSAMTLRGWETINRSAPLGSGEWMQGNNMVGAPALSGNSNSYAQVDYTSTDSLGTISDWLLTPPVYLKNSDSVSFYVLSFNSASYPDRLECRLSSMGTDNSVGSSETTVGYFSSVLVSVNPNQDTFSFPSVQVDSSLWTKYTGVVTGLTGTDSTLCRLGFRYFVTNAGFSGSNSSTIGLDSLLILRYPVDAGIDEISFEIGLHLYPNPAKDNVNLSISKKGNYLVNLFSVLGESVLSFKTESSKTIDVSNLPKGLYTVRIIDNLTGNSRALPFVKE